MKKSGSFIAISCMIVSCAVAQTVDEPKRILEKKDVEYAYPRWSADGKAILFQSNESGRWQIYRMDENGDHLVQITHDPSNNNFIDWSPDNKTICFVSDRTGNEEIFVMDADGQHAKQLTNNPARDIHPYWTPDGKKIYFNSTRDNEHAFDIYEMYPDGSGVKRVTQTADDETCARLSPSMATLVYLKNNAQGLDDVFIMDVATHIEKNITNTSTTDGWPCWTPDGRDIVFSGKEGGQYKLFRYHLADASLHRLSNPPSPTFDARPNISSDGKKIVFNRQVQGAKNTIGIYVMAIAN